MAVWTMIKDIIKTLKINHYIKNLIVIFPLFFSMNFLSEDKWLHCFIIFVSFCLISSGVYILNDIIDIKQDRLHPDKKNRPVAKGSLPVKIAIIIMLVLVILSFALAMSLNKACFWAVLSYFVLNIFYSTFLKNIALIDVACIAIGFILRITSGCFAINVPPSPLVILLTFFVSMFFTFSKRKLEIEFVKNNDCLRKSVRMFDVATVSQFILLNAILSISFYFTYVLDTSTIQRAGSQYLYLTTIPFTLIVFRLLFLVNTKKIKDDPIYYVKEDKTLKTLFALYIIVLVVVLTVLKSVG